MVMVAQMVLLPDSHVTIFICFQRTQWEAKKKNIVFHECAGLDVNSLLKDSSHNRFILEFKRDLWGGEISHKSYKLNMDNLFENYFGSG